jgi:hypothetical protein
VLYYIQELKAPTGYRLDDTKHFFCFYNHKGESCATCETILAGYDGLRIPFEALGKIPVVNEFMTYDLPATGGCGIYPLMATSITLIFTAFILGFIRWRKRERRGVG